MEQERECLEGGGHGQAWPCTTVFIIASATTAVTITLTLNIMLAPANTIHLAAPAALPVGGGVEWGVERLGWGRTRVRNRASGRIAGRLAVGERVRREMRWE